VSESPLHERLRAAVGNRSYRHVAELTGTNHESVRRYLSGQAPSVEFLATLCNTLGLSSDWLIAGRGPMRLEDVRVAALQESPAPDLLMALAHTVEGLLDRVDRIERYVQTMETRLRGSGEPAGLELAGDVVVPSHVSHLADALPQRPPSSSR